MQRFRMTCSVLLVFMARSDCIIHSQFQVSMIVQHGTGVSAPLTLHRFLNILH